MGSVILKKCYLWDHKPVEHNSGTIFNKIEIIMIKSLLKLAVFLVLGILGYNFFLGTPEEKESTKKILNEAKEVGKSVKDLVKKERDKLRDGKYDKAFDKISAGFQNLKEKVKGGSKYLERLTALEKEKDDLLSEFKDAEAKGTEGEEEKTKLGKRLEKLMSQMEEVKTAVEKENQ